MKVIVSDFQADCLTTGQRESRKKAFQDVDTHLSPENYRLDREQLAVTASRKEEAVSSATIPELVSVKLASSSDHQSKGDRYRPFFGFDKPLFSGLYNRSAVGYTLKYFERRQRPTMPRAFGIVVERAISLRNRRMGAVA